VDDGKYIKIHIYAKDFSFDTVLNIRGRIKSLLLAKYF